MNSSNSSPQGCRRIVCLDAINGKKGRSSKKQFNFRREINPLKILKINNSGQDAGLGVGQAGNRNW